MYRYTRARDHSANIACEFVHFFNNRKVDVHFHGKVDKIVCGNLWCFLPALAVKPPPRDTEILLFSRNCLKNRCDLITFIQIGRLFR